MVISLGVIVDVEGLAADDAALAPAAGDDGRVAGLAAGGGEDALGGVHAADILGAGFLADEDHPLALGGHGFGFGGGEDHLAGRGTRNGVDAAGQTQPP